MPMSAPRGEPGVRLPRQLSAWNTTAVLVGIVIGSGIYRVPSLVVTQVGSVGAAALVWIAGAGLSLAGAIPLATLAARYPVSGGAYVFIREAYGPLVAFLFGWIKLLITGPSGLAAVALIFASYARAFVSLTDHQVQFVAAGLIIGLVATNIRSVPWSATLQGVSTVAKLIGLVGLALLLFAFGRFATGALAEPLPRDTFHWNGFWVALIAVLWTFTGWVDTTYVAGEVKDPARAFPRAIVGGLGIVILVYALINAAYFFVLPLDQVSRSDMVAATAAQEVVGTVGAWLVAVLVMISTLGSLNGSILTSPRVFYAMARDGVFFRKVAAVHPRFATPHVALLVYLVLGVAGVFTQTFEQLAELFVLGIWPFYALAVGAIFVLRPRSGTSVTVRALLPAVFLLVSGAMLVNGVVQRPVQSTISLGLLALGVPVYFAWRRLNRPGQSPGPEASPTRLEP